MAKKKKRVLKMNIKELDVSYLNKHLATYNPRFISEENRAGLDHSLTSFGLLAPLVFNERTETLISGHQRLEILYEQGFEAIDTHCVDVDLETEKKMNIACNTKTISGEFSDALLEMLNEIEQGDPESFDLMNLAKLDIKTLMAGLDEEEDVKKKPQGEDIAQMELMPYEHYDCVLMVFTRTDDFLYMKTKLGLDKKRVISAPMVENKKIGYLRAINASQVINLIKDDGMDLGVEDVLSAEDLT